MPKKFDKSNSGKGSAGEYHGDKSNRGQGSGSDFRQKGGQVHGQGSGPGAFSQKDSQSQGQGSGPGDFGQAFGANQNQGSDRTDYSQKAQADQLVQQAKKSGCFPKLFILLLPFAAAATFLLLRS